MYFVKQEKRRSHLRRAPCFDGAPRRWQHSGSLLSVAVGAGEGSRELAPWPGTPWPPGWSWSQGSPWNGTARRGPPEEGHGTESSAAGRAGSEETLGCTGRAGSWDWRPRRRRTKNAVARRSACSRTGPPAPAGSAWGCWDCERQRRGASASDRAGQDGGR